MSAASAVPEDPYPTGRGERSGSSRQFPGSGIQRQNRAGITFLSGVRLPPQISGVVTPIGR